MICRATRGTISGTRCSGVERCVDLLIKRCRSKVKELFVCCDVLCGPLNSVGRSAVVTIGCTATSTNQANVERKVCSKVCFHLTQESFEVLGVASRLSPEAVAERIACAVA